MRPLIGIVGVVFVGILKWAFDHFLWDWLANFLEVKRHFKEATLIASVSSYVIPFLIVVVCIVSLYWLVHLDLGGRARQPVSSLSRSPAWCQKDVEPAATDDTNRYMTAYQAIHYLADESDWGERTRRTRTRFDEVPNGMRTNPLFVAQNEFKTIAERSAIHAIGRLNGEGVHVDIPERYWL
jgi:hypothetical protein